MRFRVLPHCSRFLFQAAHHSRDLHSFPTRRSSDLMLQAISQTDATPMVRVPWNMPDITMKSLDAGAYGVVRSEEHTSELQSLTNLVCRLLLEKKNTTAA